MFLRATDTKRKDEQIQWFQGCQCENHMTSLRCNFFNVFDIFFANVSEILDFRNGDSPLGYMHFSLLPGTSTAVLFARKPPYRRSCYYQLLQLVGDYYQLLPLVGEVLSKSYLASRFYSSSLDYFY